MDSCKEREPARVWRLSAAGACWTCHDDDACAASACESCTCRANDSGIGAASLGSHRALTDAE
jgi:hypothetical protein